MINLSIKAASYLEKQDQYVTSKNGYLVLDFFPIVPQSISVETDMPNAQQGGSRVAAESKRSFILTLKNMSELLSLDT